MKTILIVILWSYQQSQIKTGGLFLMSIMLVLQIGPVRKFIPFLSLTQPPGVISFGLLNMLLKHAAWGCETRFMLTPGQWRLERLKVHSTRCLTTKRTGIAKPLIHITPFHKHRALGPPGTERLRWQQPDRRTQWAQTQRSRAASSQDPRWRLTKGL